MALDDELKALFSRGVDAPLAEGDFEALAFRVFRHQFEGNGVYARFCRGRGVTPDSAERWTELPAVPTTAFKRLDLACGDAASAEAVFLTSGTSRGRERRGRHPVLDLELYDASLLPNFAAHLLPDGIRPPLLALVPPPESAPESSLIYMLGRVMEELAGPGGGWFVEPGGALRSEALDGALERLTGEEEPVLIAGTAFSFVHWLDALGEAGRRHRLPEGSRVMETGGFKGRSREVPREELYAGISGALGIPRRSIVNEYGMTELLSQFYEPVLRGAVAGREEPRRHVPPPWVRTRVLDPETLEGLPPGREGILHHFDLANLHSVSSILTEDLGVAVEGGGFRVLGRAGGADARGCSIAMDELLGAAER